jgi:ribosomal protein S12 methylthiotransferase
MGRGTTADHLLDLFDRIRAMVPDASLRTTVMVGFPGETAQDFNLLLDFVGRVQFDHLGAFVYCDAPELAAHRLARHVTAATAKKRCYRIMALQKQIVAQRHQRHIGNVYPVLIDTRHSKAMVTGRAVFQAPEVDGRVVVKDRKLTPGQVADLRIIDARGYDLIGEKP